MDRRRWRVVVDGEPSRANAARRALISSLRSVAPDRVEIDVNTSAHTDEYIAQRLGLLPFRRGAVTASRACRSACAAGPSVDRTSTERRTRTRSCCRWGTGRRWRCACASRRGRARRTRGLRAPWRLACGRWTGGGEADPPRHAIDFEALTDDDCPRAMWSEALDALDALLSRAEEEVRRRG